MDRASPSPVISPRSAGPVPLAAASQNPLFEANSMSPSPPLPTPVPDFTKQNPPSTPLPTLPLPPLNRTRLADAIYTMGEYYDRRGLNLKARLSVDVGGVVQEWSQSLVELTGLAAADVIGRTYGNLIEDLPLTDEYRAAALACVACVAEHGMLSRRKAKQGYRNEDYGKDREGSEGDLITEFPLPLPLVTSMVQGCLDGCIYYVELRVGAIDGGLEQASYEFGGRKPATFTLRKKDPPVPTLVEICERVVPRATGEDGSLLAAADEEETPVKAGEAKTADEDRVHAARSAWARGLAPRERAFLREAVDAARVSHSSVDYRRRAYVFSRNYRDELPELYATVVEALGGAEEVCDTVKGKQLRWLPKIKLCCDCKWEVSRRRPPRRRPPRPRRLAPTRSPACAAAAAPR